MPGLKQLVARNPRVYHALSVANKLGRYAARRPHETDFAAFALFGERDGVFLDVGANQGQSALSFRLYNRTMPIVSVEANPAHEADLRRVGRIVGRFQLILSAAGTTPGSATLYVPKVRDTLITGEATMDREEALRPWWLEQQGLSAEHVELVEVPIEVRRLDDLNLQPAFVKIDVEGAEGQVLGGLTETIERHQPIFLLEDADDTHDEVSAFFAERGYRALAFDPATRRLGPPPADQSAVNLFYVPPSERVAS